MNEIGEALRRYFKEMGITQKEIAERLDIKPTYITKIFNGERRFSPEQAKKWHEKFGLSEVFLLTGTGSIENFKPDMPFDGLSKETLMQLPQNTLVDLLFRVINHHYNICNQIANQNSSIINSSKELTIELMQLCKKQ